MVSFSSGHEPVGKPCEDSNELPGTIKDQEVS
jgi:hypothetical protein